MSAPKSSIDCKWFLRSKWKPMTRRSVVEQCPAIAVKIIEVYEPFCFIVTVIKIVSASHDVTPACHSSPLYNIRPILHCTLASKSGLEPRRDNTKLTYEYDTEYLPNTAIDGRLGTTGSPETPRDYLAIQTLQIFSSTIYKQT